jgi:hypothetical protein
MPADENDEVTDDDLLARQAALQDELSSNVALG